MNPEDKLSELGIVLPEAAKPLASYVPSLHTGNYVFISGQLPIRDGKLLYEGKVPVDVSVEDGYEAAKLAAISADDFTLQPKIINGASDLFVEIFGDAGKHTRAVMGVNALPMNSVLEIDAIVEVGD